jgi:hypothetical protein
LGPLERLRLPALDAENLLSLSVSKVTLIATPASAREVIDGAGLAGDGEPLDRVAPGDRLLAKPVNVPHLVPASENESTATLSLLGPPAVT